MLMMMTAMKAVMNDLRDHAPRIFFLLVPLHLKGKIDKSEKDNCSLETCHDREARKMAGQRMVRKNKVPIATANRG